jgi:translation initiation factor IF-3
VHTKEIKLRPFTDTHDLETKLRHIQEFLEKGNKVKVTVVFRGRERRFKEQGEELINTMAEGIVGHGVIEREAKLEGHNIVMMLAPKKK